MVLALRADSVCPNSIPSNLSSATRQFCREQNWAALATPTGAAPGKVRIKTNQKKGRPDDWVPAGLSSLLASLGLARRAIHARRARARIPTGTVRASPPSPSMLGCVERV